MILKPKEGQKKSDIVVPDDTSDYRIGHKLAQRILNACKENPAPVKEIVYDHNETEGKNSSFNEYIGKLGWFQLQHLCIKSFEQVHYLLMAC
jgi:hypothetical protein